MVVGGVQRHGLLRHGRLVSVTRGLVVVRQGNDGGHVTKNHVGMNLAVRVRRTHLRGEHRDVCDLGLVGINVCHALGDPFGPWSISRRWRQDFAVLDTEHRAHQPTRVRLDNDAVLENVPGNRDVWVDAARVLGILEAPIHILRLGRVCDDRAIHENRDRTARQDIGHPVYICDLAEEVGNHEGRNVGGDGGHQAHRLYDANRMTLWRLDRADEAPR